LEAKGNTVTTIAQAEKMDAFPGEASRILKHVSLPMKQNMHGVVAFQNPALLLTVVWRN
jgi:hypothetical protein